MYSAKHIKAVEARLQEYEEVLASGKFEMLDWCDICDTVPEGVYNNDCDGCLFGSNTLDVCCKRPGAQGNYGATCECKPQQRAMYKHLLSKLDENGYTFK